MREIYQRTVGSRKSLVTSRKSVVPSQSRWSESLVARQSRVKRVIDFMCKTSAAGMDGARGPVHELKSRRFERFSKGVATFDGNFCHCPTALIPTRPSVARSACRVVRAYSVPHLGGLRTVNRPPLCSVSLSGPRYGARNSNAAPSRRRSPAPLCARTREPGPTLRRGRTNVDRSHQALGKTGLERAAMTATAAPGDSD
jgi:hypothetical protein